MSQRTHAHTLPAVQVQVLAKPVYKFKQHRHAYLASILGWVHFSDCANCILEDRQPQTEECNGLIHVVNKGVRLFEARNEHSTLKTLFFIFQWESLTFVTAAAVGWASIHTLSTGVVTHMALSAGRVFTLRAVRHTLALIQQAVTKQEQKQPGLHLDTLFYIVYSKLVK